MVNIVIRLNRYVLNRILEAYINVLCIKLAYIMLYETISDCSR